MECFFFFLFSTDRKKTPVIFGAGFNARCVAAAHKSLHLLRDWGDANIKMEIVFQILFVFHLMASMKKEANR